VAIHYSDSLHILSRSYDGLQGYLGRDSSVGITTYNGLDRNPVAVRFSATIQTGPGAHPDSYTMGTGSFLGVKRPALTIHHHPALRLKKEYSYTFTTPVGLRDLFRVNFTFILLQGYSTGVCFVTSVSTN